MQLARSRRADGNVTPVVGHEGRWFDLTSIAARVVPEVLSEQTLSPIRDAVSGGALPSMDGSDAPRDFAPPLERIGKIVCIGLNYVDHAEETNATPPAEPILFMKAPDTVIGAADQVLIPRRSTKTDYEVELAVVIGSTARYLDSPTTRLRTSPAMRSATM
jgi:2-keto-4-pentenoate hydratase/2-oxohepta-3-ene-1,7-dioic acid hydratase in catechol pathway